MKDHISKALGAIPKPLKEWAHTVGTGMLIGGLTAGTAKIFHKLNVPHPAESMKAPRPHFEPSHPKQTPRWQPRNEHQQPKRDWSQYHRNRQSNSRHGDHHGRG